MSQNNQGNPPKSVRCFFFTVPVHLLIAHKQDYDVRFACPEVASPYRCLRYRSSAVMDSPMKSFWNICVMIIV